MEHNNFIIIDKIDTNILEIQKLEIPGIDVLDNIKNLNSSTCSITNQDIQKIISTYGPIIATINNKKWMQGRDGQPIWNIDSNKQHYIGPSDDTSSNNINHTVIIIGWDHDKSGTPYWIIKNSWGTDWAYNGFTAVYFTDDNVPCKMFDTIAYIKQSVIKNIIKAQKIKQKYRKLENQNYELSLVLTNKQPAFIPIPRDKREQATLIQTDLTYQYSGIIKDPDPPPPLSKFKIRATLSKINNIPSSYKKCFCWASPSHNPLHKSIISNVKNQGHCNSCWIFDCLDILSSSIALNISSHKVVNFSVQKFINILNNSQNNTNPCMGGYLSLFNKILTTFPAIFLHSSCTYLNMKACKADQDNDSAAKCTTTIGCDDCSNPHEKCYNVSDSDINKLGASDNPTDSHKHTRTFDTKTIIFLVLMICFFIAIFYQLYRFKFSHKNILTGSLFCFIISTILFSLFISQII